MSFGLVFGGLIGVIIFLYALHWIVEAVNVIERSDG